MEADLKREYPAADIHLVRGRGGVFDVIVDGTTVFSKHRLGRFPEHGEVLALMAER